MAASIRFRKKIAAFLVARELECNDEAEWESNMRWLDRSGLALPLAAQLEAHGSSAGVPPPIVNALRTRLQDNGKRMDAMFEFFEEANFALATSGVRYCCVKGFSLIPDCFAAMRERHQVDLDFLISPLGAERARMAIEFLGYRLAEAGASGEMRFVKPWRKYLGADAYLYQMPEAPPIELHTAVWEAEVEEIDFPVLEGFLEATKAHELAGARFPCLRTEYQFVYLLLHIFRHLLGSWCRLLSLFEIATLLRSQRGNTQMWTEASGIIEKDEALASACALVLALVKKAFPTELPEPLAALCDRSLSLESALWIEKYSDGWLFSDPPGNKLALLVQRQFCPDRHTWRQYVWRRLLPLRKAPALCDEAAPVAKRSLAYRNEELRYAWSRIWYHLRSDYEYLKARLRWAQLLRVREV